MHPVHGRVLRHPLPGRAGRRGAVLAVDEHRYRESRRPVLDFPDEGGRIEIARGRIEHDAVRDLLRQRCEGDVAALHHRHPQILGAVDALLDLAPLHRVRLHDEHVAAAGAGVRS
jgi:hypothetical protein